MQQIYKEILVEYASQASSWRITKSISLAHCIMNVTKKKLICGISSIVILLLLIYWLFFSALSSSSKPAYIYITEKDTPETIYEKIDKEAHPHQMVGLKIAATLLGYSSHIHTGRYAVGEGKSTFTIIRNLRGGRQATMSLVIPVVHTINDLAGRLSQQLGIDSVTMVRTFTDKKLLASLNVNDTTVACLFIPNTYEVYWDITPEKLLKRMKKEHDNYWTDSRVSQAKEAGLTTNEVYILASIVEQESANENERPMIAGMYLNRLHQGMKLQADPTVKYALGDFGLRRIMHNHLTIDSPYNTYKYAGLPVGPICIPSLNAIESVLNYTHHDYLYMCAKEDFSGTHNFASTYEEHMQNAKRYAEALNKRGIN